MASKIVAPEISRLERSWLVNGSFANKDDLPGNCKRFTCRIDALRFNRNLHNACQSENILTLYQGDVNIALSSDGHHNVD